MKPLKKDNLDASLWVKKGGSMSMKNACKEFGLKEPEILQAIDNQELHYKLCYAHGNPYLKLLTSELQVLAEKLYGKKKVKQQKFNVEIQKIDKEINSLKRKIKVLEKKKADLLATS
jgi:hypothetical protein